MKTKAEEEQKSQLASDARRWNGLKTMVEARALLKSIFKVATTQKAQARLSLPIPCIMLNSVSARPHAKEQKITLLLLMSAD